MDGIDESEIQFNVVVFFSMFFLRTQFFDLYKLLFLEQLTALWKGRN